MKNSPKTPLRLGIASITLTLITTLTPAFAITLAPGQSGMPEFVTNVDLGSAVAITAYQTTSLISDVGIPETFESRVIRESDGKLTFWYITTADPPFLNIPQLITLPGFAGLTTNVHQFASDPFSTSPQFDPFLVNRAMRSADGNSITVEGFLAVDHPTGTTGFPALTLAVTTDATSFQLSDAGYQPEYILQPYHPPGPGYPSPLPTTEPRPAFIPGSVPEPLSLLTLPFALSAWGVRRWLGSRGEESPNAAGSVNCKSPIAAAGSAAAQ